MVAEVVVGGQRGSGQKVINLFGGPYAVIGGARLEIPEGSKRLVAFLAIHRGRLERRYVAGSLWPCVEDIRAAGNLRSALWRLRGAGIEVVVADKWAVELEGDVGTDLDAAEQWAERIVQNIASEDDLKNMAHRVQALNILPGCYDDWALIERERVRQRTLHALEAASKLLVTWGRCGEAVEAAMMAVAAEPLRESAQKALINAHLREGNLVEARRAYILYEKRFMNELGVAPSPSLTAAVRLEPPQQCASYNRRVVGAGRAVSNFADGVAHSET